MYFNIVYNYQIILHCAGKIYTQLKMKNSKKTMIKQIPQTIDCILSYTHDEYLKHNIQHFK